MRPVVDILSDVLERIRSSLASTERPFHCTRCGAVCWQYLEPEQADWLCGECVRELTE